MKEIPSIEDAKDQLGMIAAVTELVKTIKSVNRMFVGLAVGIPIILALFMVILSTIIMERTSTSEQNVVRLFRSGMSELAEKMQEIHQTQSVHVGSPTTKEDLIKEEMLRIRNEKEKTNANIAEIESNQSYYEAEINYYNAEISLAEAGLSSSEMSASYWEEQYEMNGCGTGMKAGVQTITKSDLQAAEEKVNELREAMDSAKRVLDALPKPNK